MYRKFHGKPPKKVYRRKFGDPKVLVYLGEAILIEYVTNKINGGGDGKMAIYVHKFKKGAKLYTDEEGKGQLYILGSAIRVQKAGIVN